MAIDFNAPVVGAYCERASSGFWAEPFNAGSSLLVIVLGLVAVGYLVRSRLVTPLIMALMGLAVAIGTRVLSAPHVCDALGGTGRRHTDRGPSS